MYNTRRTRKRLSPLDEAAYFVRLGQDKPGFEKRFIDNVIGKNYLYNFYRATLCIRSTSHGPVSVCPSQVGVLLKRLNIGSHKQHHTIAQGL